jgi:hypothetical protein
MFAKSDKYLNEWWTKASTCNAQNALNITINIYSTSKDMINFAKKNDLHNVSQKVTIISMSNEQKQSHATHKMH